MNTTLTIKLSPVFLDLLQIEAAKQELSIEALVLKVLCEKYPKLPSMSEPRDDWERLLLSAATNCGVTLPHEAFGREELYD